MINWSASFYGFLFICLWAGQSLIAQNKALEYGDWTEPLFNDNTMEFEAPQGYLELSLDGGAFQSVFGLIPDLGIELEAVVSKKLGVEFGFYSAWHQHEDSPPEAHGAVFSMNVQYNLTVKPKTVWATGIDFNSKVWTTYDHDENNGWEFRPFLINGYRWANGLNTQWRFSPSFEFSENDILYHTSVVGSFFMDKKWFNSGIEAGTIMGEGHLWIFVAPQVGVCFDNYNLTAGWYIPNFQNGIKKKGLLLLSFSYWWSKNIF